MRNVPFFVCLSLLSLTNSQAQDATPKLTTIHSFNCTNGKNPVAGPTVGSSGVLYGTTQYGGPTTNNCPTSCGVVYSLTPPAAQGDRWTSQVLYEFTGNADGGWPFGPITVGANGVLYGTTTIRGAEGYGTVFSLTPPATAGNPWTFDTIFTFNSSTGGGPYGGVVIGSGGILYGSLNQGTAFSLTPPSAPGGTWAESSAFNSSTIGSVAPLALGAGGILYGTSELGGADFDGEVYSIVPPAVTGGPWDVSTVYSFAGGSDGYMPTAGVTINSKGVLYGTTYSGGGSSNCLNGCGTIYSITPGTGGAFAEKVLYAFDDGANGSGPYAGVALGSGGVLYSATQQGGNTSCTGGCGTIISLTPPATKGGAWTPTLLHSFSGTDGAYPDGTLARSGNVFYGTTNIGGADECGTVFSLRP